MARTGCWSHTERVLLSYEQVRAYELPATEGKHDDPRWPAFARRYGFDPRCPVRWEVEALESAELRRLVLTAVGPYIDRGILARQIGREEEQRRALAAFLDGWDAAGRGSTGRLYPLQRAFIDQDAFQRGYCTPGQIMSGEACVREGHSWSRSGPGARPVRRARTGTGSGRYSVVRRVRRGRTSAPATRAGAPCHARRAGALYFDVEYHPDIFRQHFRAALWLEIDPSRLAEAGAALAAHPEVAYATATTGTANLYASIDVATAQHFYRYLTESVATLPGLRHTATAPIHRTLKGPGPYLPTTA
ncbi:2Fe-2S iron-sulfur cluster-binding protein [Streptomyces cuspidosporus]|uniref:Transcription regulator AsnC/Lrp ligand binding domain-containing protein n=1 Tax=Streptomyces cuspidosporus TaxID=66882 RepID=A0ABP5S8D6_9ACTN